MMADWSRLSRAERDAAYNNSAAVADSPALNQARIDASARTRSQPGAVLDLTYGDGERQRWDLFPAADKQAPCFTFIHGGYWQRNRREDFCSLGDGLRAHGWSAAFPGYTLAPAATMTEIVAEIGAALDWLAKNGAAYGVGGRVLISGWSAGGHLAAMALGHTHVAAGLAISGVYELGPIRDTYLNEALRLTDPRSRHCRRCAYPRSASRSTSPTAAGNCARWSRIRGNFHALRAAAHCPGALLPIAGADHFTVLDELSRPDGMLVKAACGLLSP